MFELTSRLNLYRVINVEKIFNIFRRRRNHDSVGWVEPKLGLNEKKYIVTIDRRKHLKHPLVERVVSSLFKPWSVGVVWCHNLLCKWFYVILKINLWNFIWQKKWQLCLNIFMKYRFNLPPGEGLGFNRIGMIFFINVKA